MLLMNGYQNLPTKKQPFSPLFLNKKTLVILILQPKEIEVFQNFLNIVAEYLLILLQKQ